MSRVLIVDDEVQVLNALRRALTRRGFQVLTAVSGAEALNQLEQFQPEIVVSDFQMPGMNGAELLATVRVRAPQVRRVILSGYADPRSVIASFKERDISLFLNKPWDDDQLAASLRDVVSATPSEEQEPTA